MGRQVEGEREIKRAWWWRRTVRSKGWMAVGKGIPREDRERGGQGGVGKESRDGLKGQQMREMILREGKRQEVRKEEEKETGGE